MFSSMNKNTSTYFFSPRLRITLLFIKKKSKKGYVLGVTKTTYFDKLYKLVKTVSVVLC